MNFRSAVCVFGILVASTTCASAFQASFKWCGGGSPTFALGSVPKATVTLMFAMTDLDVPSYNHGGGSVPYTGQKTIACGALTNYTGPNPPGGSHTYRFAVTALDAKGSILGTATASRRFPEK